MKICLMIAWLCNLADTAATLYLCGNGYAMEINPVMAWMLQWPLVFAMVKIAAMTAVAVWVWCRRESRYARIAAAAAVTIYGSIAAYYLLLFAAI